MTNLYHSPKMARERHSTLWISYWRNKNKNTIWIHQSHPKNVRKEKQVTYILDCIISYSASRRGYLGESWNAHIQIYSLSLRVIIRVMETFLRKTRSKNKIWLYSIIWPSIYACVSTPKAITFCQIIREPNSLVCFLEIFHILIFFL